MSFFAISAPPVVGGVGGDQVDTSKPGDRVFRTKAEALKAMKSLKNSRMKTFSTLEEAETFASELPNG